MPKIKKTNKKCWGIKIKDLKNTPEIKERQSQRKIFEEVISLDRLQKEERWFFVFAVKIPQDKV